MTTRATALMSGTARTDGVLKQIATGGCSAWALPPDEKSPGLARSIVRRALADLGFPDDYIADVVLCVSELTTNAIVHARGHGAPEAAATAPELWLYRRGHDGDPQLVVAVFDSLRRLRARQPALPRDLLAEGGRGLDIVGIVAAGQSGWHLTRSRLGGWQVPGKACWFALPIPESFPPVLPPRLRLTEAQAAGALASLLVERGLTQMIHQDAERQSVLSVRHGLTVWCRAGAFWWTSAGVRRRRPFSDIIEVGERVVQLHEELVGAAAGAEPRTTAM
ncbi:MAG TPA: ATP-binding protein [Streptosporangiaceae bacterium]